MLGVHKSISLPQSTEYAKEMAKWEAFPTQWGGAGRPFAFHEFPKALYRFKYEAGQGIVKDEMHVVNDEHEQRNMQSRGFHLTQEDAIAAINKAHTEHGKLAAEREWEIQHGRISPLAAAEVRSAEAAHGSTHMPVVPETPIKRRGRKPKAVTA